MRGLANVFSDLWGGPTSVFPAARRASFSGVTCTSPPALPDRYDTVITSDGAGRGGAATIPCMANVKGLDPWPRAYSDDTPARHISYLEEIRRAGNAVRVLRKHGKDTGAARLRFKWACRRFEKLLAEEEAARNNPTLF